METKKTDQRKILLFLPLLVLPFMALAFYALGGGKANENANQQVAQKGINTSLPDASFNQKEEPQDKMGFYQQNDRDSSGKNNGIKNVADRLGFNGQEEDPQTKAINEKLKALNTEIAKPTPVASSGSGAAKPQPTSMKNDVDRLEALMKAMKDNKEEDPEMAQLSGMMDKIIAIQNPGIVQDKLKQQPALQVKADSAFKAIPAVIEGSQKVAQGAVVKLRLLDSIHLKEMVIPKNQLLFGSCNITNQRLLLTIKNIRLGSSIIPVDLSVFSLDGLIGIDAPEAELGEAAGNGATDAMQGMQFLSMDQSIGVQAAGAGIDAAKNLLSKKVKRIRVKLKGGQQILLRNNSQRL